MDKPRYYQQFMAKLEELNARYDPEAGMLRVTLSDDYNYHSNLRGVAAHPTRNSLGFAVHLLDSGVEEYRERACRVLRAVLELQDTDPDSSTYGIWPYYREEPLARMSAPDWNWADFCGKELLQVLKDHSDRIPAELVARVRSAVRHAARSIMRRDVGPDYTNIAIMGTYVTLLAGQLLGEKEFGEYGRRRLARLYEYTLRHGGFTEYNSPTYTVVALKDLSRMLLHIEDEECFEMTEAIHDLAWRCVAEHFHPPTAQWSGPHSRCYRTLQGRSFWSLLELASGGKLGLTAEEDLEVGLDWHRSQPGCPEQYRDYFLDPAPARLHRERFYMGDENRPPHMATTYMSPRFSLGTFHRCDLWNQRRALVAYWGSQEEPRYLHLRCLHDGYDYSSAVLHTVQSDGRVLSVVNFATDGGDRHISLDMIKRATIEARDLRLRLELGGLTGPVSRPQWTDDKQVHIRMAGLRLAVSVPYCAFADRGIGYEVRSEQGQTCLDIVLHTGSREFLQFGLMQEAVCVMALEICSDTDTTAGLAVDVQGKGERVSARWERAGLELSALRRPERLSLLYGETAGRVDGVPYRRLF